MNRFRQNFKVYFIEEPVFDSTQDRLEVSTPLDNLVVIAPHLRTALKDEEITAIQKELLAAFFIEHEITNYFFWYYTPMALAVSDHFNPLLIIYDCMDEVSAVKHGPASLKEREKELLRKADVVMTSGQSLYEAKKNWHPDVHAFPSGVDAGHFGKARFYAADPHDQETIPRPRIGYFGVIDERLDLALLEGVARRKPDWHLILVGPVARINPGSLPKLPNIHYLGMKPYNELPVYMSGWDIAMVPFAHNESTRYINPSKTPEYLAAGKPVISTPIIDVLRTYGRNGLVKIAGTPEEFVRVATLELENTDREEWLEQVKDFLSHNSWDKAWQRMMYLVTRKINEKERSLKRVNEQIYV